MKQKSCTAKSGEPAPLKLQPENVNNNILCHKKQDQFDTAHRQLSALMRGQTHDTHSVWASNPHLHKELPNKPKLIDAYLG